MYLIITEKEKYETLISAFLGIHRLLPRIQITNELQINNFTQV